MWIASWVVVSLMHIIGLVECLDNGLGLTPPLGYNAYDHVGCCANETILKEQGNFRRPEVSCKAHPICT